MIEQQHRFFLYVGLLFVSWCWKPCLQNHLFSHPEPNNRREERSLWETDGTNNNTRYSRCSSPPTQQTHFTLHMEWTFECSSSQPSQQVYFHTCLFPYSKLVKAATSPFPSHAFLWSTPPLLRPFLDKRHKHKHILDLPNHITDF